MADFGQQIVGQGLNTGVSTGVGLLAGRALPFPSVYNPNSPNHFGDSEFNQILHGNGRAVKHFAGRTGGRIAGATLGNLLFPGLGGIVGGIAGGWLGGKLFDGNDKPQTGTVGGSPATTTSNSSDTGDMAIDPWTGQPIASSGGTGASMPTFDYGPWAQGYQGLPDDGSSPTTMPDFSDYSNQLTGPLSGNGDGGGSGDYVSVDGGMGAGGGGGWLAGGGMDGFMNGASGSMMTDFSAPTNGDFTAMVSRQHGIQGLPKAGASRR